MPDKDGAAVKEGTFTRFDLIAVAVPGAAFLILAAVLVRPDLFNGCSLQNMQLGTLGLFAIAALCAGQMLQAIAAFVVMVNRRLERSHQSLQLDQPYVPGYLKSQYAARLAEIGYSEPYEMTRADYRRDVHRYVTALVRSGKPNPQVENANLQYNFNRALGIAFVLLAVCAFGKSWLIDKTVSGPQIAVILAYLALSAIAMMNASRYELNFERELTHAFIIVGKPKQGADTANV